MQPVTKLHHKVVELHHKLPDLTRKHIEHAFKTCFEPMAMIMRKTIFCLECGHSWKDNALIDKNEIVNLYNRNKSYTEDRKKLISKCPGCKKKIEFIEWYNNGARDSAYYEVITTIEGFQVYRFFEVCKIMKKKEEARPFIVEIVQRWIAPDGKKTIMAVPGGGGYYGSSMNWSYGKLEIKHDNDKYRLRAYKTYPKKKYLPVIEKNWKNGFKENGDTHGFREYDFISAILSSPVFETILKKEDKTLTQIYINNQNNFVKFWPSIKIVLRNNYKQFRSSPANYFDYLNLLKSFGKDLYSPKYICPENLHKEHDKYVKKMREIQKKRDLQKTIAQIEKDQIEYNKLKSKFFNLEFKSETENLVIKTITDITELLKESDILSHCAFTNKYHNKKDSLLMSAYLNNVVIKTIEIDLGSLKIVQCRGYKNDINGDVSGKQKEVIKLLKSNLYQIKEILYPKKEKKLKADFKKGLSQIILNNNNQYQQAI